MVLDENKENIKRACYERIISICNSRLNSKNLFKAINEFALSKLNYYVGIIEFKSKELSEMDCQVRLILRRFRIHMKPTNVERLYIKGDSLGRGLDNIEHKVERISLNMHEKMQHQSQYCQRRNFIMRMEKRLLTQFAVIKEYLKEKYQIKEETEITSKILIECQKNALINKIKNYTKSLFKGLKINKV
jgi:hypothetical protein